MAAAAPAAAEEDTELRDLLVQTLESNGVLARIKAELRAAVFLALEEQEKVENKTPLVNESLKKFLTTKDGRLVASLVAEFLQFFNLDFTLAVFQPETSTLHGLEGRENLARDLGIIEAEGTVGGPLLLEVIRRCQQKERGPSGGEGALDLSDPHSPPRSPEGRAGSHSSPSKKAGSEASQSDTSLSSESRSRSGLHPKAPETEKGPLPSIGGLGSGDRVSLQDGGDTEADPFFDDPVPRPEEACGWRSEPGKQAGGLASLSDAPPLRGGLSSLTGTLSLHDSEGKRRTSSREPKPAAEKGVPLAAGTAEDEDYADDFNSTSHCSERSQPSVGEEVEEDLSVDIDDLSTSDKLDDLTQDLTVSQLSDVADYLEDVA
ncbi:centrosomal protein 43 isoform X2 [Talpa occidentalis]|uniref:centrosomal protein 43 isoform X2 n=1 Tax=Talpa occidentalis TaxID=50954 RepID=UPI00188F2D82|nr:centrosomal protein 43 isoform X2 [Talpa occidentalis]